MSAFSKVQNTDHPPRSRRQCAANAEVIGSAIAILLLTGGAIPLWAAILLSAAASFLLLLVERFGIRHLEALFGLLIATMVRIGVALGWGWGWG